MKLYQTEANEPKLNAQRNLAGRTHYVDDETLRFHKSRILATRVVDDGLLFALIESVGLDWHNTRRGFRYVVFDVYGRVIFRLSLEDCYPTRAAAEKAMWQILESIDARALTVEAIDRAEQQYAREITEARAKLASLAAKAAA